MRKLIPISALAAGALSAAPGVALDCAKAKAPVENAICGDPDAEAADEAMTKAYNALAATLSPQHMAALVTSQRRWLKRRADICLAREGAAVAACLATETAQRRAFLAGEPLSGPGLAQKFRPVLIQHVGKPYQYDLDVNAQEFADPALPGERLFNAKVDQLLEGVPKIDQTGFRQDMVYSYILDVSATFASPKFVSGSSSTIFPAARMAIRAPRISPSTYRRERTSLFPISSSLRRNDSWSTNASRKSDDKSRRNCRKIRSASSARRIKKRRSKRASAIYRDGAFRRIRPRWLSIPTRSAPMPKALTPAIFPQRFCGRF